MLGPEVNFFYKKISGLLHRAKLDNNKELEQFCNTLENSVV
jgi:isocitrate dehydrogenase